MFQGIQRPWHRVRMLELIGVIEFFDFVLGGGYCAPTWILRHLDRPKSSSEQDQHFIPCEIYR